MNDKYIGKLLDNRYEILQVIGTGGMAVVYKALCHRLNRYVAVKILKDEYAKDEEFRNRFHSESHAVAMLSHPNIVAVYDVSRSNSIEYIVMELIDGMTLKQYMDRRGTLSQKEAIHFITQILKALSHAHSKGIIHRDIKPHNIMLLRDSTVKVTDFGIARLESSQRTVTREAFGSVHYIAPEQAKGSHIDCRADIYSAGVVLYEMLTGRLPYEGDTPVSVAIQHINSMPLSPREINSEIPEPLEKITMKAMSSALSKRYASTDEMLADLDEYKKNPNIDIEYEPPVKSSEVDMDETKKLVLSVPEENDAENAVEQNGVKAKLPLIVAVLAIGVFFAGVLTLLSTIFGWGDSKKTEALIVPDILGMTLEEAGKRYNEFEIIETDEEVREYSDEYEEGEIIKQRPKENEASTSGKIYVTLSKGKKSGMQVLTDLTDMSEEQAKIILDREGVVYTVKREKADDTAEGCVIKTEPEAGNSVSSDDIVILYISLGKEQKDVLVPNLYGLTEIKAIESLAASNLEKGNVGYAHSNTALKGTVIGQEIQAGDSKPEGTSVGFTISLGPEEKKPDVTTPNTDEHQQKDETKSDVSTPVTVDKNENIEITRSIRLPTEPESFVVKITVNGTTQYEKTHKGTDGSVDVSLTGNGEATVCVYINDVLRQEIPIDFK